MPRVPERVQERLRYALGTLRAWQAAVESARHTERLFGSTGRYEWELRTSIAHASLRAQVVQAEATLAEFAQRAVVNGVDAEAVLMTLGGRPAPDQEGANGAEVGTAGTDITSTGARGAPRRRRRMDWIDRINKQLDALGLFPDVEAFNVRDMPDHIVLVDTQLVTVYQSAEGVSRLLAGVERQDDEHDTLDQIGYALYPNLVEDIWVIEDHGLYRRDPQQPAEEA